MAIQFDENRPRLFRVILSYENAAGELLELNLDFDTTKNNLDWNFIESPTEPNMQTIYRASVQATQQILLYVLDKAKQEYREKQKAKQMKPLPPSAKAPPRQRTEDEIYQLRKQVRLEAKPGIEALAFSALETAIDGKRDTEKRIFYPRNEILEKMLDKLSSVDRQTVLKGIDELNNTGRGEFTRKRRRSKDGKILYTLRVNCSVSGGIRVLLHESESSTGVRNFEILDISYRKDTYKKAGI